MAAETDIEPHEKCPLLKQLPNESWNVSTDFTKTPQDQNLL
jgi:hypothetical protein